MKITFPTGQFISSGPQVIHTRHEEIVESWMMGELVETTKVVDLSHDIMIQEPAPGTRGTFAFADRTFTVVRDDDVAFWDDPDGKAGFLDGVRQSHLSSINELAEEHGWEIDAHGNPLPPPQVFSITELNADNKTTMAHVMALLGVFKSVGEARRNGWDKPLELGDHCVTKRKIRFRIVE